jgi:hypothetical protein
MLRTDLISFFFDVGGFHIKVQGFGFFSEVLECWDPLFKPPQFQSKPWAYFLESNFLC